MTPHATFLALGSDAEGRQAAYRELLRQELEPGIVDRIRDATNGIFALGNARSADRVGQMLGRRSAKGSPGRPRNPVPAEAEESP